MKWIRRLAILLLSVIVLGFLIPQKLKMPVDGATSKDYNQDSFWFYPWGKSITHKGVDVFAKSGTTIYSATQGIVVGAGQVGMGGNYVLILGPKWRFHYYAHLQSVDTKKWKLVSRKSQIGTVGASGNAAGKPPHLHYSIATPIPYLWRIDKSPQGWKKMFYLNPIKFFD